LIFSSSVGDPPGSHRPFDDCAQGALQRTDLATIGTDGAMLSGSPADSGADFALFR
jgi:hypothetical protein